MKKILILMLAVAMLFVTSLAFAGGGQNCLDPNEKDQHNTEKIVGNVWWD